MVPPPYLHGQYGQVAHGSNEIDVNEWDENRGLCG